MPLKESQIISIEASIKTLQAAGDPLMPGLRSMFPDVAFVRCSASDMDTPPYRSSNKFLLYLLDRSELCIKLTDQLDCANGVVVAEVE